VAKASGASRFLGLLMALSVLRLGRRQARENRTATPACRELPYPAPPSLAYAARLGRQARGRARGASIAVHGMMTPVRTNGDAPASEAQAPASFAVGLSANVQKIVLKSGADAGGPGRIIMARSC
jgi:hypothetical protein